MINQKPISARIHVQTLFEMELEKAASGLTRNHILNEGARLYLYLLDLRRRYKCIPDPESRQKLMNGFLKLWIPEAAKW